MANPAESEVPETSHSAPGGAAAAMELIAELEERLEKAQAEKERLQRDVDELCKQQVGQGLLGVAFGSSEAVARIHARRVSGLEDQIRGWKAQNQELTKQAAEMQAEIRELHRTKTIAQQALRDADERARLARADVAHFQNQVAAALGQRDEALLEADQAKERCEKALSECEAAQERCEKAIQERDRLGTELAELKAEVGRFLHEGGESGALRSPPEAIGQDAAEGMCQECGRGSSRREEEGGAEESDVNDEAVSEEEQDTASEGSFDEESVNAGRLGEDASEPGEASDGCLNVQKGTPGEGFASEAYEAERRAMHERVESLEEQLRLVTEERELLRNELEASKREEKDGGNLRAAVGTVAETQFVGGVVKRKGVETQIGTAADASASEETEAELRESTTTALGKETHTEAESEVEREKREPVRAESLPRVNVFDVDALGAGLVSASSALQAQLSQLLNEPGVASVLEETAERAIASQELPESATSSAENRSLDLSLSSTHPWKLPRPNRVSELDESANLGATSSVNSHKASESPSDQPSAPSNSSSDKPPDSGNSRLGGLSNSDGLSAIPGEEFDVRRALAQAAQEKVAALVLLSQQEERHEMEARQTLNLHARLGEAQERLADVVQEKVAALLEVAQLREEVKNLKDSERRLSALIQQQQGVSSLSSRLLPAVWSKPPAAKDGAKESGQGNSARSPAVSPSPSAVSLEEQERTGPTSPSWFSAKPASAPTSRRHSGNGTGTGTGTDPQQKKPNWYRGWIPRGDVSKRPARSEGWSSGDEGGGDVARLRVEFAALQERVATVDRLTASVHKLRTRLAGAVSGVPNIDSLSSSQSVSHVRAALETIEAVATEAGQLKTALGGSLPVSYSEEGGYSTSENEGVKTGTRDVMDTAAAAGVEMAELIIATAEVQRGVLQKLLENDSKGSPQSGGLLA
ncbi:hypothetical protein KFL_000760120 [Klebsormidium nitens]|uniref:Myosin heavy chain n=1 Tax=Klebsormidium nitens TaxID=105231 RepID=A0A1Y1HT39_KLENI|nr:hypothetical protein KFL_000760120 [Klebsormidium nitens]|eukprot:GAQ81283.1 hypothetical protein KFL_000760120 [Klebsormidium nitens]